MREPAMRCVNDQMGLLGIEILFLHFDTHFEVLPYPQTFFLLFCFAWISKQEYFISMLALIPASFVFSVSVGQ